MEDSTMFRGSVFYELGMACDNVEERAELWQAIMEYGLYGKEPPQKFKRDFINIRFILEKSRKISYLRGEAGKKHSGNQYTQGDNKRKTKEEAQKNVVEQMEQNGTNGTKQFYSHSNNISSNDKIKYLEYVYLSSIEYEKLIKGYGSKVVDDYIDRLNNRIGEKPRSKDRKDRNHYFTILSRLRKDGVKKLPPPNTSQREDGIYDIDF